MSHVNSTLIDFEYKSSSRSCLLTNNSKNASKDPLYPLSVLLLDPNSPSIEALITTLNECYLEASNIPLNSLNELHHRISSEISKLPNFKIDFLRSFYPLINISSTHHKIHSALEDNANHYELIQHIFLYLNKICIKTNIINLSNYKFLLNKKIGTIKISNIKKFYEKFFNLEIF